MGATCFGQNRTDAESIFKMFLFLNTENVSFKGMDITVSKNDSLYKAFSDVVYPKLDILKNIKSNLQYELAIPKYKFYELVIYDTAKKDYTDNIIYKRKLNLNEGQFFGVYVGGCDSYIIAINQYTGASYRLKGFNINDFLAFLSDFREEYSKQSGKQLSTKSFLNGYAIEGLDFECLYDGLTAKEMDRKKYPCLRRAADITPVSN